MNLVVPYFLGMINTVVPYWYFCTVDNNPIFTERYSSLQTVSFLILGDR